MKSQETHTAARAQQALISMRARQELVMKVLVGVLLIQIVVVMAGVVGFSKSSYVDPTKTAEYQQEMRKQQRQAKETWMEVDIQARKTADGNVRIGRTTPRPDAEEAKDPYEGQGQPKVLNPLEAAFMDEWEVNQLKQSGVQ